MTDIEIARPLTPAEISWKTAQRVSNTPFVPTAFRGKPEAVFAAILFGEELGIGPMGFGGKTTLLGVKITAANRVPASFFVSVSYMCWAFRRQGVELDGASGISRWLY